MRLLQCLVALSCSLVATHANAGPPAQPYTDCQTAPASAHQGPLRVDVRAGAFQAARTMTVTNDPAAERAPASFPRTMLAGVAAHAGVYYGDHGIGITVDGATSVGATLATADGEYTLSHSAVEAGLHYRDALGPVDVDVFASLGRSSYEIRDLPESIALPDVSYSYAGSGIHVDRAVASDVKLGASVAYQYLLDAGDLSHPDWYGAGRGRALAVGADLVIALPRALYVKAAIDLHRIAINLDGSGAVTQMVGAYDITDTTVSGSAQLGTTF